MISIHKHTINLKMLGNLGEHENAEIIANCKQFVAKMYSDFSDINETQ